MAITTQEIEEKLSGAIHAWRHKRGGPDVIRLDELGYPTQDVNFGGRRGILLSDPVDDQDAVTKQWCLDNLASATGMGYLEDFGNTATADCSTVAQAAITALAAANKIIKLKFGGTYRFHGITVPAGAIIDARGAIAKVPDGVTAQNMFTSAGAWLLRSGVFDGNKAAVTDPGSASNGCGIYQFSAGGWSGVVQLLEAPVFHDFCQNGIHGAVDITSLTDGANAPYARMYLDRVETYNNGVMGQRFTGIRGLTNVRPDSHNNGSHGIRTFLCREVSSTNVNAHDNPSGHGYTSLYCYDQEVSGRFNLNGTDGLVFGGDATSTTNQPGRYIRVPYADCNGNSNIGLVLDATITASTAVVPVWAQLGEIHADGNTNEGVIINSSQYVFFNSIFTDNNGGHGLEIASKNVGFGFHHAHGNAQKPLALEGSVSAPNNGAHFIGDMEYAGNTPDDTITIGTVLANSTWDTNQTSQGPPPALAQVYPARKLANTSRNTTVVLAADPELFVALPVGEYQIDGFLVFDGDAAADLATSWNLPTGSIIWGCASQAGTTTTNNPGVTNYSLFKTAAGPVLGCVGVGTDTFARITGYLTVTVAGTLTFKWAQNTSNALNTTLQIGSWIRLTKIA